MLNVKTCKKCLRCVLLVYYPAVSVYCFVSPFLLSQFLTQGNQIVSLCQVKNLLEHPLLDKPRSYLPLVAFATFALPLELYK